MGKKVPKTRALRVLEAAGVAYGLHPYDYVPRGGTRASSDALGIDEHTVVKTLVFEVDGKKPVVVLMHGDCQVSGKALARHLGVKTALPADPAVAERHTGYQVGGTSPFGTRKPLPVVVQDSVLELDRVYVNGGRRGLLVDVAPRVFVEVLRAEPVDVAQ
jgi:Cys-tRNA(Pro) deacylase